MKQIGRIATTKADAEQWAAQARETKRYESVRIYPRTLSAGGLHETVYVVVVAEQSA